MNINEISVEGFMRFKSPATIPFSDGINVIYGNNGAGKTSLLDAICLSLYGKTYRTGGSQESGFLKVSDLINRKEKKAAITMKFSLGNDQYKIEKTISLGGRSKSYLYKNEVQIAEGKKVYELISKRIIGLDYSSFRNSSFIAQHEARLLINASGAERREILKKLFKLDIYNDLYFIAGEMKKKIEIDISKIDGQLIELESRIKSKSLIESDIRLIKSNIDKLNKSQLENTEDSINDGKQKLELKIIKENISNKKLLLNNNKLTIERLLKEIEKLNYDYSNISGKTTCPVCLSKITNPEHINQHYKKEMDLRKIEIGRLNNEISATSKTLEDFVSKENDLEKSLEEFNRKIIEAKEARLSQISKLEGELKSKLESLSELNGYLLKLNQIKTEKTKLVSKVTALNFLKELYNDIPNIIIQKLIPYIEREASEIVSFISNDNINGIKMDNEVFKIVPVVNGQNEEMQFLSGGETLRVGLAVRLAISKIISSVSLATKGVNYRGIKTLIIDEGDFGSLDDDGISSLASLFGKLKEKFSKIIFITHVEELKDNVSDYAFMVKKIGQYESEIVPQNY